MNDYIKLLLILADVWVISYGIHLFHQTWIVIPLLVTGIIVVIIVVVDFTKEKP
jgi:hypothetical protein